jgi:hypothetical protein
LNSISPSYKLASDFIKKFQNFISKGMETLAQQYPLNSFYKKWTKLSNSIMEFVVSHNRPSSLPSITVQSALYKVLLISLSIRNNNMIEEIIQMSELSNQFCAEDEVFILAAQNEFFYIIPTILARCIKEKRQTDAIQYVDKKIETMLTNPSKIPVFEARKLVANLINSKDLQKAFNIKIEMSKNVNPNVFFWYDHFPMLRTQPLLGVILQFIIWNYNGDTLKMRVEKAVEEVFGTKHSLLIKNTLVENIKMGQELPYDFSDWTNKFGIYYETFRILLFVVWSAIERVFVTPSNSDIVLDWLLKVAQFFPEEDKIGFSHALEVFFDIVVKTKTQNKLLDYMTLIMNKMLEPYVQMQDLFLAVLNKLGPRVINQEMTTQLLISISSRDRPISSEEMAQISSRSGTYKDVFVSYEVYQYFSNSLQSKGRQLRTIERTRKRSAPSRSPSPSRLSRIDFFDEDAFRS